MIQTARKIVRFFSLQGVAARLIQISAKFKPNWTVQRNSVTYELDLTKMIDLAIFTGGWEPETARFLQGTLEESDVVIEVGANIGAHTLFMAKLVDSTGVVYAFEPTEFALRKLRRNLSLNSEIENVVIIDSLVSDTSASIKSISIMSEWNISGRHSSECLSDKVVTTIDDFAADNDLSRLDLLKIDVDGFDYKVLLGARETISRFRPVILCELCEWALRTQNVSIQAIFTFLESLDYKCFDESNGMPLTSEQVSGIVGLNNAINGVFLYSRS